MDDTSSPADDDSRDALHAFAELALITVNADPAERTLHRVAELAKRSLGGAEDVSLTVIRDKRPDTVIFTGALAVDLDERQYELGFGPCLDAAKTGQTILVDTSAVGSPYDEFARIAARAGVRHVVSVGLPLAQRSVGGLNIYCTADAPLSPQFVEHAEVFAGYAAVAVNNVAHYADVANDAANMRAAMASRAVIEQAKGIIMGRDHCTAEDAFDVLRRISQQKNVKLRELAQAVVDSVKQ